MSVMQWKAAAFAAVVSLLSVSACTGPHAERSTQAHRRATAYSSAGDAQPCTARGRRAVEVYAAMLSVYRNNLPTSGTTYVVRAEMLGIGASARPGPLIPDDVVACITRGLAGFRHVVVVASATDRRIRKHRLHGGAIPVIEHGFVVAFGPVPAIAGRTEIDIDTGGGFGTRGGEFCVGGQTSRPLVSACGTQWIS